MTTSGFFESVDDISDVRLIRFAFMPIGYGITETEIIIAEQERYYYRYIVAMRSPFCHIELVHWKQCSYTAHDNLN